MSLGTCASGQAGEQLGRRAELGEHGPCVRAEGRRRARGGLAEAGQGGSGAAAADQLADAKAAGKSGTATDMHYAPFDVLIGGVYQGMTKDLFDEAAKELGVEPVYQDIP